MEWQPIETAPHDKSMVALLRVDGAHRRYGVGWYMPWAGWQAWGDAPEPTHWCPLPPPPKEQP